MTRLDTQPHENDDEDGDHDQFDLGSSFDDLEPGYFEIQTHLPADIHEKYEEEHRDEYDDDPDEELEDEVELESNNVWSEAIEDLKSRKEKLDKITIERNAAQDEYNVAKTRMFHLLDSNNVDSYTTDEYVVRKVTHKGRVSYKNAMAEICGGETDLFFYYANKYRSTPYFTLRIKRVESPDVVSELDTSDV